MNSTLQLIKKGAYVCTLLIALAAPGYGEQSRRGLFEGSLAGGGKIVFFVQGNHAISAYVFNTAAHQASFGGAAVADDGAFALTTFPAGTITGHVTPNLISATVAAQNVTASRVQIFGASDDVGGRFSGNAVASSGSSFDARFLVDSQGRIFFVGTQGSTVIGGFGTTTVHPAATAKAAMTQGGEIENENEIEHGDEIEDEHEDDSAPHFSGVFTITLITGQTSSGTLDFSHGRLTATFPINGVSFTFRGGQESSENHLINVSTRGFVTTGQGQLIGGFIISGGPKLVLIRALGPTLAPFGVSPVLADPQFRLVEGQTVLAQNDSWRSNANAGDIVASGLSPRNASEPAVLLRLEPGAYTTVVTGANNAAGISLVEVYEIEHD